MKKLWLGLCLLIASWSAAASPALIEKARLVEADYGLPAGLLETVCAVESNWRNVGGHHGEVGVCQIKPATVRMICPSCEGDQELLSRGDAGERVYEVQVILKHMGLYTGRLDGLFGPKTEGAVRLYQRFMELSVDGIVGPNTWKAMFGTDKPYSSIIAQLKVPEQNIEYAGMFLNWLSEYLDTRDPDILAAAYNGGPGHPVVTYMLRVRHKRVARL